MEKGKIDAQTDLERKPRKVVRKKGEKRQDGTKKQKGEAPRTQVRTSNYKSIVREDAGLKASHRRP